MTDQTEVLDRGPFFHGTKAALNVGDQLEAHFPSNYQDKHANYIYFTATLEAAKWGAELAKGDGAEHIYLVEPLGTFDGGGLAHAEIVAYDATSERIFISNDEEVAVDIVSIAAALVALAALFWVLDYLGVIHPG